MLIMVNLCDFDLFELLDDFLRLGTFDIDLEVKGQNQEKANLPNLTVSLT